MASSGRCCWKQLELVILGNGENKFINCLCELFFQQYRAKKSVFASNICVHGTAKNMPPMTHGVRKPKNMNDGTQEKQARPMFRFLAGIVSLMFYAIFLRYIYFLCVIFDGDIQITSYLVIPIFIFLLFLPIAVAFSFLSIKGVIPKRISKIAFGRKFVPGKRFFK